MNDNLCTPEKKRDLEAWLWVEDQKRGRKPYKNINRDDLATITRKLDFISPTKQNISKKQKRTEQVAKKLPEINFKNKKTE